MRLHRFHGELTNGNQTHEEIQSHQSHRRGVACFERGNDYHYNHGRGEISHSVDWGGWGLIAVGGALFGMSLRMENKEKASDDPSEKPK